MRRLTKAREANEEEEPGVIERAAGLLQLLKTSFTRALGLRKRPFQAAGAAAAAAATTAAAAAAAAAAPYKPSLSNFESIAS